MPIWLQVFYIALSIVVLGWAAWMTKLVLAHDKLLAAISERCSSRGAWIDAISESVQRTDRNVVRLGSKLGFETELEHPQDSR